MKHANQSKLQNKKVTLIGAGALGTVIANHLVRGGIGELRLVDRDFVEESNLQRQILYDEDDAKNKVPKAVAASEKLGKINSQVTVLPYVQDANPVTIENIVSDSDLIMDATDNMETRFLLNDVSIKYRIPWIYGGAVHSRGMTMSIIPGQTPCFRCLFPHSVGHHGETCDTVGVLGPVVDLIASYQTSEALKILNDDHKHMQKNFIQIDVWYNDFDEMPLAESINPNCSCCQQSYFEYLEYRSSETLASQLCGRDTIQITAMNKQKLDLVHWERKWSPLGQVQRTPFLLRLYYESYRLTLFEDGRLLIQGTNNLEEAKQLYARFIGL